MSRSSVIYPRQPFYSGTSTSNKISPPCITIMQCFGSYDMLPGDVTSATLRVKIGAAYAGHEAAVEVIYTAFMQRITLALVALRRSPRT